MSPYHAARLAKALVEERAQAHGNWFQEPKGSRSRAAVRVACAVVATAGRLATGRPGRRVRGPSSHHEMDGRSTL